MAIVAILAAVGFTYYRNRVAQARHAVSPPKALPLDIDASATDWVWSKDVGSRRKVDVRAKTFRQLSDPGRLELGGLELRIHDDAGKSYDRIRSAKAQFDLQREALYSDGEVEIVMGVPVATSPPGRLLKIVSSGVTFESATARAHTDREAVFAFDQGEGRAVGASYDPTFRELVMKSEVELNWRGATPNSTPMKVEAGELVYKEADSYILLKEWARLTRNNTTLDAAGAVVWLKDGAIHRVEAKQARGGDRYPDRQLQYAADELFLHLSPQGEIEKIEGFHNARLLSSSATARTSVSGDRLYLFFDLSSGESALKEAFAMGSGQVESVPLARPGAQAPETRRLRSEQIVLAMRPGGREIDAVETRAAGRLEFLPTRPGHRHRVLDADGMRFEYGSQNRLRAFLANNAATRTESDDAKGPKQTAGPPTLTWSKDLVAQFDEKTGQLARLEQWNDFRYEEGDRKAQAHRATLEQSSDLLTLERDARVWDPSGAVAADRILLQQKSGDLVAEGNVVSSLVPDRKGKSSAVLSNEQPLEASAQRMETSERNQRIRYEGQAVTWQGANRLRADFIEIDRHERRLVARGNVRTQFVDEPQPAAAAVRRASAVVVVESAALVYTEAERLAHYTGGARLTRPGMNVHGAEIRAWLNGPDQDNSLDRAYADGRVEITRTRPNRTLKGTGEHAQYYAADQRIVLTGGRPTLVDSLGGSTTGQELTYYANTDKLLVNGLEKEPVVTRIPRR